MKTSHEIIIGELKEFKRAALERLDELETKVDSLRLSRAKMVGGAMLASLLASTFIDFLRAHL